MARYHIEKEQNIQDKTEMIFYEGLIVGPQNIQIVKLIQQKQMPPQTFMVSVVLLLQND
jgi:hypothetical protein